MAKDDNLEDFLEGMRHASSEPTLEPDLESFDCGITSRSGDFAARLAMEVVPLSGFWVGWNITAKLLKPATLEVLPDQIVLSARYDPPGSGWRALLVTIVTVILVTLVASTRGFAAAPGWLFWYWMILLARRKSCRLKLEHAESVVIDTSNSRIAFRVRFCGATRWCAFETTRGFEKAAKAIQSLVTVPCVSGRVAPNRTLFFIFVGIIAVAVALVLYVAVGP
jgi:hypothetical protein